MQLVKYFSKAYEIEKETKTYLDQDYTISSISQDGSGAIVVFNKANK